MHERMLSTTLLDSRMIRNLFFSSLWRYLYTFYTQLLLESRTNFALDEEDSKRSGEQRGARRNL